MCGVFSHRQGSPRLGVSHSMPNTTGRLVPLVDKAPLPLRIQRLVTSNFLQVENPTHPTAHALEKIFQHKLHFFQLL